MRRQKTPEGDLMQRRYNLLKAERRKMPNQDPMDTSSLFSLSEIREQMKVKKNSALKTTKINASVAAKIKTKAINNSSIIKVTLKQNNKALALALSAAKREVQKLIIEKMLLQKEVKQGDFERAHLRQKLLAVVGLVVRMHHKHSEYTEELQQFMSSQLCAIVELSSPSERDSCSVLPFDGRLGATDMRDHQAGDNCPVRTALKIRRIPLVPEDDDESNLASTRPPRLSLQLPALAVGEPRQNVVNPGVEKPSSFSLLDEPLANSERNGQPSNEMDGTALVPDLGAVFGGKPSSIPQSSRSCSLSTLNHHKNNPWQCSEITRSDSDQVGLSLGNVTQRRKRTTGFSHLFRVSSWMELPENGPSVGLMLPKETEPPEISQMGELVTLETQNKPFKNNAGETEVLEKMSTGTKGRDSSANKSEGNLDTCNEGAGPGTSQPKALENSTTSTEVSTHVNHLERIQPRNSHRQNKGRHPQDFSKTVGPPTVRVVSPYHVHNLSFFENSGSSVKRTSQYSDETRSCEKISAVDLYPQDKAGTQTTKNRACVVNPLHLRQSLESFSWLESPPSAPPVLLDDAFSNGECRKWCKTIPTVQGFSAALQNTTLLKTSSSSLEKTRLGARSQTSDVQREDPKAKANRKAHTENNVMDLSLDSHHGAQAAKSQKTPARSCALPKTSADVNKNDAKQVPSGRQKTTQETPKESSLKTAPHLKTNKILTDLTNATQNLCHSASLEEPSLHVGRRAKKPVNYEEPKLNRKLRRGDQYANSDFFSCPIYKTTKKMTKSKAISKESS